MRKRMFGLSVPGALGYMFLGNVIVKHVSGKKIRIPMDHVHYYATRNGNIGYLRFDPPSSVSAEQNPPLLLIHELYPGFSAEEWRNTAKMLARRRTVYAIDLPGCGRSDKPILSYTQYLYVQTILQFVEDVVGIGAEVITSGHSLATAILVDRMNPDAFRRIIAVNPPPVSAFRSYPDFLQNLKRSVFRTPIVGTHLYNIYFSKNATTERLLRYGFYDPAKLSPQFAQTVYQSAHFDHQQAKYLFSGIKSRYLNLDITESLRIYIHKLYFIMGSSVPSYKQIYASYREQVPNTGLYVIGETAMLPHVEAPKKFCQIIQQLLDK